MATDSIEYVPRRLVMPYRRADVPTAWSHVEDMLEDMLDRFDINRHIALEFGVDYGYSASILSNFFEHVVGIDTFEGDGHAGFRENLFAQTCRALEPFENISLSQTNAMEFIQLPGNQKSRFNLIHVDLFHVFDLTYTIGSWAVAHADITIFHDTIAFPEVKRACLAIANETGRTFYEYRVQHGVGILVKE